MTQSCCLDIASEAVRQGAQQKSSELAKFLELLIDSKPQVIVEIGTATGGTLYAWRQVAPKVIGIDDNSGGRDDHGAAAIIGNSHDETTFAALVDHLQGTMVDCLFIDGDHTYDGVREDYEMYRTLVASGGLIAFHDIATNNCGVPRFYYQVRGNASVEIIDPDGEWCNTGHRLPCGGIGVLR